MEIKCLGNVDYNNLRKELKTLELSSEGKQNDEIIKKIIDVVKTSELNRSTEIVSAAGRLSRTKGDVNTVVELSENKDPEDNEKFIKRVTGMGHSSILDHQYLVFAIKNVTPIIEQTIIEERFSSFTIKSRREADFSNAGFYVPNFRDNSGKVIKNNQEVQEEYKKYVESLFTEYSNFVNKGIEKEDARFILPYSYYSNILMGVDAHTLKDMIIKYTKTKYSDIPELYEFGLKLKEIAQEYCPYIIEEIDKKNRFNVDEAGYMLKRMMYQPPKSQILDKVKLTSKTPCVDYTILSSAIKRRYQYNDEQTYLIIEKILNDYTDEDREKLFKSIAFNSDGLELSQVNFQFQVPVSLAVLTHITRHRTIDIIVPDFELIDIENYKIPPKIKNENLEKYKEIFRKNIEMYYHFLNDYHICKEDLIYFLLSGNMVNIVMNLDGKTFVHFNGLRECTKAQWETRTIANQMHNEVDQNVDSKLFEKLLGPSCVTENVCREGKESCKRILSLKRDNNI